MKAIGIDIGTTSISAIVMDANGEGMERSWTIANPGFMTPEHPWERIQNADSIVETTRRLLDEIIDSTPEAGVIGLTGQMHGIVYVDGDGHTVSPLMTWQDMRAAQPGRDGISVCDAIAARWSIKAYPGYGLMTHLHNVGEGAVPANARKLATICDYLGMAITGRKEPLLHSGNAASLGLYDLEKHAWRRDILAEFGEDGGILPEVANRYVTIGSYRGIPVGVALGDNQASFQGSVSHGDEEILIHMGTGGQISLLSDRVLEAEEIETRPFNEDSYLIVGPSLCGGRSYALLAGFFKACAGAFGCESPDVYAVMARFLETPEEADPMVVDTTFDGTREKPGKRGGISNLSTDNFTPQGLTRGVLNGMARELLTRYRTMEQGLGIHRSHIVASGNGMRRNPALQRIAGEQFGMSLSLSPNTEEAACGAAIAGTVAIGLQKWEDAVGFVRRK